VCGDGATGVSSARSTNDQWYTVLSAQTGYAGDLGRRRWEHDEVGKMRLPQRVGRIGRARCVIAANVIDTNRVRDGFTKAW